TRGGAAWETLKRYYGTPELSPEELEDVRGVFRDCGALAYAEERAEALFDSASGRLEALGGVSEEGKTLLRGFMAYLRRREA
ncbi:MAG: hypothetical protein IJ705_01140, partial [Oscillospiraceae bacterium]|nr:hypothetical protein [Oscillospiraceae bacterium]